MTHRRNLIVMHIAFIITVILCLSETACLAQRDRGRPSPVAGADTKVDRIQARRQRLVNGSATPWLGVAIKDMPRGSKTQGVLIEIVTADSPADKAGLLKGDIITNLADKPIASSEEFKTMALRINIGQDYPMSILRGDDVISVTIRPVANPVSQSGGTQSDIVDTPAPRKGPLDINTLKYALIDPKTRVVTFIGSYDPAYATGPIPYADILKDAMDNLYPSFSIEPTQQQRTQLDQVDKMIAADIRKMDDPNYCNQWAQKLLNLLLNDASLQADNKRLFRNFGAGMGLTGDELKRMYDAAEGKAEMSPNDFFEVTAKLMRGIGAPGAADGLLALASSGTVEDKLRNMAKVLGLSSEFEGLEAKGLSGEQFRTEGIILCISEMCRQFEAPESGINSVVSSIRSGAQPATAITGYMGEQMGAFITNKAGSRMMNGLVMGPELLAKIYNMPVPKSDMVFKNVASDSSLGDVLFKADYRLKSICTFPDARDKVPGHMTDMEFAQKEAVAKNCYLPAGSGALVGHRLVPGDVKMRVSPNGDVVEFQDSQVKVLGWVIDMMGSGKGAADFINTVTPKYADYLTQHYKEYSKVYPEWHKMSEVAKTVALARWAKKNNYTIQVENASGAKISHPSQVNGFWSAVFQVEGEKASLILVAHGGASFSPEEGEDWVKPEPDVTVTSDVSKQLIASTVFAEQAVNALKSGDLEAARDLADKSARAMTGEIDLTTLPSLDGIPSPGEPAAYAAATAEVINEASDCLNKMDTAQKDLARAGQLAATSPDEAAKLTQQATQAQDEAQARLKQLLDGVSTYKADPSKAADVVVALHNNSTVSAPTGGSTPTGGNTPTGGQIATPGGTPPQNPNPKEWSAQCSEWVTQLDKVHEQVGSTQKVLLNLSASIQSDKKQFDEWEKAAGEGIDRCLGMISDMTIELCLSPIVERQDVIYELAKKLPGKPADVIEKYRYLASLAHRLKEAKATNDVAGLAKREGKTEAEIWEIFRDGIGQISGLLGLDKLLPAQAWKYGSNLVDMTYNLTELSMGWKNVAALEANNARYSEAVKKLAKRMGELQGQAKDLHQKIEEGCVPGTR